MEKDIYTLAPHVTDVMLEQQHFRLVFDNDIRAIKTLQTGSVFIEHNGSVLFWGRKDIQDLIAKGLVKEAEE